MYIGIYHGGAWEEDQEAKRLRDLLKANGLRSQLTHSCYVGMKLVTVHKDDLKKAVTVFRKNKNKFLADCCKETLERIT